MGRNIKQGFDYFPLYTDFFTNKKIKNLRRAHGSIGVLTYLNLLSRVYKNGYYYKFDDLEELSMDIAEEIANVQLRATATSVTETINYLVGRGILAEGLFKQGIISGVALQEQYVIMAYKAKRKTDMGVHCLVDVLQVIEKYRENSEETPIYSEEIPIYSEFGTQSKSKVNKREVKYIESTDVDSPSNPPHTADVESERFSRFWEAYPKKKSKADALNAFKKINPSDALLQKMLSSIEEQKKSTEWKKENGRFIPYPSTWLTGGCWEDEPMQKDATPTLGSSFDADDFFAAALKRSFELMEIEE